MLEPGELLSTMDAKVWADEFMETKARLGEKEFDHAMMLGWFANAIMAGFDEATRRQQATIADLQGQLKAAKAPRMYDCGSCAIGKGFEQRVAQLEGEKQEYMQAATNEQRLALPMPKRTVLEPFGEKASRFTIHYDGGHPGCKVVIESADGALDAIAELLTDEYRKQSSLPAHRAKLAQGGAVSKPVTTCNRHSDCDAADEKARAKGALNADHCHDDCCSECFGN